MQRQQWPRLYSLGGLVSQARPTSGKPTHFIYGVGRACQYGVPGVHFDVASASGPQLHRISKLSTLCPHYSRSLSAPFPQHLHNLSALFSQYFRIVTTVEPPNKGHFGSGAFVLCVEIVLWWKVRLNLQFLATSNTHMEKFEDIC